MCGLECLPVANSVRLQGLGPGALYCTLNTPMNTLSAPSPDALVTMSLRAVGQSQQV